MSAPEPWQCQACKTWHCQGLTEHRCPPGTVITTNTWGTHAGAGGRMFLKLPAGTAIGGIPQVFTFNVPA